MEKFHQSEVRVHDGISVTEPTSTLGSGIEDFVITEQQDLQENTDDSTPWSYLFVHNRKVDLFTKQLDKDRITYFIHKNVIFQRRKDSRGIQTIEKPSVSGLIFLRGFSDDLQNYLSAEFPSYHLVNDCSTHHPAVISHSRMVPFMRLMAASPDRIRFLLHPLNYYAGGNTKIRITSGFLSGIEGYIVRIDRDRRLIMDVGGMTVAVSGVHLERFEVVEDT